MGPDDLSVSLLNMTECTMFVGITGNES